MKTQLRLCPHKTVGETLVELWYRDQFLGTIAGADGPGIRVITKHPIQTIATAEHLPPVRASDGQVINVLEVRIHHEAQKAKT